MTSEPEYPKGWYPDYASKERIRFWDGNAWSNHTLPLIKVETGAPPPPPKRPAKLSAPAAATKQSASRLATQDSLEKRLASIWVGFLTAARSLPARWRGVPKRIRTLSVAALATIAVIIAAGTTFAVIRHDYDVEAAKAAAVKAEAAAERKAAREALEAKAAAAKKEHEDSLVAAKDKLATSEKLFADSGPWADQSARKELQQAIADMKTLLAASESTTSDLQAGFQRLVDASTKVGTPEAAQDRQYKTLVDQGVNNGRFTSAHAGRDYCTYLDQYYTPANVFQNLWMQEGEADEIDVAAVRVYCPKYTGALNVALSAIFDGTHVDGIDGFTSGPWHTVGGVSDCYWELSDGHGNISDNNFINAAPGGVSINVSPGQTLVTKGCKAWVKG